MMMIKSSWCMLIVIHLSFWEFNLIFTLVNGISNESNEGQVAVQPPYELDPMGFHYHQRSNKETRLSTMRPDLTLLNDKQRLETTSLYENRIAALQQQLSNQEDVLRMFLERKASAVRPSSKIKLKQRITNLEVESMVSVEDIVGSPTIDINSPPSGQDLKNLAQSLRATINRINDQIPQIVIGHRDVHIGGNVYFRHASNTRLISGSIELKDRVLPDLLRDLVYRNSHRLITGPVYLTKRSSARNVFTRTINSLDLAHVAFKGHSYITGPLRVRSLSCLDVAIQSLDQFNLDHLIPIDSPFPVIISSPLVFDSRVEVSNDLNVSRISGVHLPTFRRSALTIDSDQIVGNSILIRAVQAPTVQLRTINDLDYRRVTRLVRTDLKIGVPKLIVSSASLVANNFSVRSLNDQRFPDHFLLANSASTQTIPVPITFSNLKITRGTTFNGLMNGLQYPKSFITLDEDETIDSNLVFSDSVSFNKDITSDGYIGRHRMSDLADWTSDQNPMIKQLRDNPTGNVHVNGNLQVTSTINGIQFDGLLNDLVHLADPSVIQVTGTKTFVNPLNVPSIKIRQINGSPVTDFVSSLTSIASPIRFVGPLAINNLIWKPTGKDDRISDLINKRISLIHEGTIDGDIYVENMSIGSLEIDPLQGHRINSLSPRQLVFSKTHQHIHAPLTLTDVTFSGSLWTTKLLINRSFNKRDMNRVMKNSINPRKRQNFSFDRLVLKNCQINVLTPSSGDWRVRDKLLIRSLRNILLKYGDQIIYGRKRFLYPVSFTSPIKSRSSRGVLHGTQKGPLFVPSNIEIKHNVRLSNLIIHGNLKVNGKLNGIDFSVPLIDLQMPHKSIYSMMSSQSFYSGLKASRIQVNHINGVPFNKYWSKRKSLNFLSPVTANNLIVEGQVHLNGLLNNLPIQRVVNQIRNQQRQRSITIHGDVVFRSPINIRNNLNVSGLINGIDFGWLTRSLSQLSTIKEINGVKTFRSIHVGGNLHVNRFNGQQLSDFFRDIVLVHPNAGLFLASPVEFTSLTTIRHDINSERLRTTFNSNVNGVNMRNLLANQKQQFRRSTTIVFNDPVFIRSPHPVKITGRVNNMDLQRDVIWLRNYFQPYQRVTGRKTFKRAHFMSDVYVHSTLNGMDWTDRLRRTIHPRSTENITTNIRFGGKMILTNGLFVSMIDDIPATSLVATNQKPQSIIRVPARWIFNGPSILVRSNLRVDGRIKNVPFNELIRYSMKKHIPQTINVPMSFDRIVLKSMDPVAGMFTNLQSIQRSFADRWNQVASRLETLDQTILSNGRVSRSLNDHINSSPAVIKEFHVIQQFSGIVGSIIDVESFSRFNYSFNVGSMDDEYVVYNNLVFDGSQFTAKGSTMKSPYIAVHSLEFDKFRFNLFQASPNSTSPSVLIDNRKKVIGHLTGRAYDDLKILSINRRDKLISALSSVRGVVETFTITMVDGQPKILLISTINVTPSAKKISLFMLMNEIYLAIARSSDSDCESENSSSLLFHWLDKEFKLIQRFGHFEATNVAHYAFNGHFYLVFSESKGKVDRLTDKAIHVYQSVFKKWPSCQFNHFHSINFEHAIDLQVITIPSPSRSVQLLAALNSTTLTIWQQKGNAGFEWIWSQSLNEGQSFKFFTINTDLYLIVAQLSRQIGSFIMKAIS